jgi:hypothetical protein
LGKYSEILAVPILNAENGKMIGVLSVDVAHTASAPNVLEGHEIVKLLERMIGLVRPDLS